MHQHQNGSVKKVLGFCDKFANCLDPDQMPKGCMSLSGAPTQLHVVVSFEERYVCMIEHQRVFVFLECCICQIQQTSQYMIHLMGRPNREDLDPQVHYDLGISSLLIYVIQIFNVFLRTAITQIKCHSNYIVQCYSIRKDQFFNLVKVGSNYLHS